MQNILCRISLLFFTKCRISCALRIALENHLYWILVLEMFLWSYALNHQCIAENSWILRGSPLWLVHKGRPLLEHSHRSSAPKHNLLTTFLTWNYYLLIVLSPSFLKILGTFKTISLSSGAEAPLDCWELSLGTRYFSASSRL